MFNLPIDLSISKLWQVCFFMLQSGLTPLHLTAQEDRVNAAEVLAKNDANLDQQTKVHAHINPHVISRIQCSMQIIGLIQNCALIINVNEDVY